MHQTVPQATVFPVHRDSLDEADKVAVPGFGTEDDSFLASDAGDEHKSEFDSKLEEWRQSPQNDSSKQCSPATIPESVASSFTQLTSAQSGERVDFFAYMSQAGFPPVDTRLQPWKKVRPKTKTRAESNGKMVVKCSGIHYYSKSSPVPLSRVT